MTGPRTETENQNQEPQNQPQNNPDPNQNQQQPLETPTPNTPQLNTDFVPRSELNQTLDNTHSLYRQALTEGESQRRQLQERLDRLERERQNPQRQVPDDELTPAQLIERSVAAQVAPLREQFSGFMLTQQQQQYLSIKNNLRHLPQLAPFFTQLEPYLDQEMQGKNVTVEGVQEALAKVIGKIQLQNALQPQNNVPQQQNQNTQYPQNQNPNQLPQQNYPNQNQNQNPQMNNIPPHLRPSAPPLPNRNGNQNVTPNGNQLRPLTELEKRVAREQRPPLSDAQYIDWISEDPTNVVHSQIGIPPRPQQ